MVYFLVLKQYSTEANTIKYCLILLKFKFKDWIKSLAKLKKIRYNIIKRDKIDEPPSEN